MRRKSKREPRADGMAEAEAERARRERVRAARARTGTAAKPRAKCTCPAYPWPHRPRGGNCRYPDPPERTWQGRAGQHPFGTFARVSGGSSSIRRRIIEWYGFHPIRDGARIHRWLPKLYAAWSRRQGWPWVYVTLGGWVPAMRVTDRGVPKGVEPYNAPDLFPTVLQGTSRKWDSWTTCPALRRRTTKTAR